MLWVGCCLKLGEILSYTDYLDLYYIMRRSHLCTHVLCFCWVNMKRSTSPCHCSCMLSCSPQLLIHQLLLKPLLKGEAQGGWKIPRAMESDEEQCLRGLRMLWRYSPLVSWERYHDNNLKELEYVFQNFNFNHITIFKSLYSWVRLIRIHVLTWLSLSLSLFVGHKRQGFRSSPCYRSPRIEDPQQGPVAWHLFSVEKR